MSPFLTYAESMPSKPGKELCAAQLPKFLRFLAANNKPLAEGERFEEPS